MSHATFSIFDFQPGRTVLERFRIVKPLRQSGLSAAFEAEDERDAHSRCTLVVFSGALFEGAKEVEQFRNTWKPWTKVRSPHVPAVREIIALPQRGTLLVVECADGVPLKEWLRSRGPLSPADARALGLQLVLALEAIHEHELVHGDIKPQNILVAEREDTFAVALVDGGVTTGMWSAKHLGEHTALIGTPFYAPIEQFSGESPDKQSDIYNVATVLFECATGVLPWPGKTMLELFQAKLERGEPSMKRRAPKSNVPAELEAAIVKGLLADRRERYMNAEEFREALALAQA
ncbi:MAG: serine/threonine protein kinase [Planctomycetes bacterium]|nr:serine/threonine protein kinase [Planctomycetota bacterium]